MRHIALISILLLADLLAAQRPLAPAVLERRQNRQDVVDAVRSSKKPFFEVLEEARRVWDEAVDGDVRDRLKRLPLEEGLKPNVLTGVGILLASEGVREVLPAYLDALHGGRLNETQQRDLFKYVLLPFHREAPIFDELEAALLRRLAEPERFKLVLALYPQLVTAVLEEGEDAARERFEVTERLALLWRDRGEELAEDQRAALRATLEDLAAHTRSDATPEAWLAWLEGFRGTDEGAPRLDLASVYRHAWEAAIGENERLTRLRREEVGRFIERLRAASEPPVSFLFKADPEIRRAAVLAIASLAADLPEAPRGSALDEILRRLEAPESATLPSDVLRDVYGAAGALANNADEARRKRLAKEIFARPWPEDPAFLDRVVEVLGKIRVIESIEPLEALFVSASRADRVDQTPWVDVREGLVEIARLHPDGAAFVRLGLQDPRAEVRRVAALTGGLMIDRPEIATTEFAGALARQAQKETDPLTRKQILETLLELVRRREEPPSAALLEDVFVAWSHDQPETRRLLVEILHAAIRKPALDPALRARALDRIREALADRRAPAFTAGLAAMLAKDSEPDLRSALIDWAATRAPEARDASWTAVRDGLVPTLLETDLPALRGFARKLAELGDPQSADLAVAMASELVARLKVETEHPLAGELDQITRDLNRWRERGASPQGWSAARAELDRRLAERPNDARLLFRRAVLNEKLAARGEPEQRQVAARGALADYAAAVGDAAIGLQEEERIESLRRLAALLFAEGDWGAAADAVAELVTLEAASPADRLLGAKAVLLDAGSDLARFDALLPGGEGSWRVANPDRSAVLDAAMQLFRPRRFDPTSAAAKLAAVGSAEGELAVAVTQLSTRAERSRVLLERVRAWTADPKEETRDAVVAELEADPVLAETILMAVLAPGDSTGPEDKAAFDLAKRVLERNDKSWKGLAWPATDSPEAWSALGSHLQDWIARPREAHQKSLLAVLKAI